jgi:nickel-type superoxide dismutase maturation protease
VGWPLRIALVSGPSMVPALRHGDRLLVWLRPPRTPAPGTVVLVALPDRPLSVKRVVDVRADGAVWVEGDNELASTDSRSLGVVPASAVKGVALVRLWPRPRLVR